MDAVLINVNSAVKQRHDAGSCGRLISKVIACYEAHFLCYEADDFDLLF